MDTRQKKKQILSYVLYLTLACVLIIGLTYARYRSTVTGTATAAVAKVDLNSKADLSDKLTSLTTPGNFVDIDVTVSNSKETSVSEVTQDYTIKVETTGNLPLEFTLTKKNPDAEGQYVSTEASSDDTENSKVWSGGQMPHSKVTEHTYVLNVKWKDTGKDAKYAFEIEKVTLTVDAKQAQ